jgi:hypothetical protein
MANIEVTTVDVAPGNVITIQLPGSPGPRGEQGVPGLANVLSIGTVTTLAAGASASATISGVSPNQILNLKIPQGVKGDKGDPNVLTVGLVTTLTEGQAATATITGTAPSQILNLGIPRGYGVRPAGLTGDLLVKLSNTDHDTGWETPTGTGAIVRKSYADTQDAATLTSANSHSDGLDAARKTYVDNQDAATLASAKSYTDTTDSTRKTYVDNADTALGNRVTPLETANTNATSAATASTIVKRDAAGRAQVATPASAADIATKGYADGIGTASSTASTIMRRGADGSTAVADVALTNTAPSAINHATRKDYVDTQVATRAASVHTHLSADLTDAASAATASKLIVRDANGRAQVATPSASADIATKGYVDGLTSSFPYARLRQTVAQTGLANGWADMVMGVADLDSHAGWAAGTPSRYTVPAGQGGIYAVTGGIAFAGTASSGLTFAVRFIKSGSAIAGAQTFEVWPHTGGGLLNSGRHLVSLAAGDFIIFQGYVNGAGWATMGPPGGGNEGVQTTFQIERVR